MSRAIVLLSGGVDSMATARVLQREGHQVEGLFIDYGHAGAERERTAALSVGRALGISIATCDLPGLRPPNPPLLPGRNGLFLHIALHACSPFTGLVGLGIHGGTDYADCSPAFLRAAQALFDVYTGGSIGLVAPFIRLTKADIWTYCREEGLPVELTYSCESGSEQPCGACPSCDERRLVTSRS